MIKFIFAIFLANACGANIYFGVGSAFRGEAKELSAEVGPSRDPVLRAFYQTASEVNVWQGYSTTASAPWGGVHDGIDVRTATGTLRNFVAAEEGHVTKVDKFQSSTGNWQVNVEIVFNKNFDMIYSFETFSSTSSDGDRQLSNILVSVDQRVQKGEVIGKLVSVGEAAHVHFSLKQGSSKTCPGTYMEASSLNEMLTLLRVNYPGANLCYE